MLPRMKHNILNGGTTGFQSQAQDYLEPVIDLSHVLNLDHPGIYPVRVDGDGFAGRGIMRGDILIADTTASLQEDAVAVACIAEAMTLVTVRRRDGGWCLSLGNGVMTPVSDHAEIWAIVTGLVRDRM